MQTTNPEVVAVESHGASVVLRREPWDCEQLGLEAGKIEKLRAPDEGAARDALKRAVEQARAVGLRHLAARVDTTDRIALVALQAAGFRLVDTVVTLSLWLSAGWSLATESSAHVKLRWATAEDSITLAELSSAAFSDPAASFNRYLNDGGFSEEQVRRVYGTWARTSIGGPAADATLLSYDDTGMTGFLTLKFPGADGVARVPLNAVAAAHRGRGVYRSLVVEAAREMQRRGASRLDVTTQLQQLAVQKTWWRLGARAISSSYSMHLWLDLPGSAE